MPDQALLAFINHNTVSRTIDANVLNAEGEGQCPQDLKAVNLLLLITQELYLMLPSSSTHKFRNPWSTFCIHAVSVGEHVDEVI
ncbi:hypothetical protein GUJ93_ZPchr0008g13723 [Zizania palustris]|uniref:Uncharacterized protein n=1 Tax=Zizania palustris TaxID=103762 RepID=A0A8J5RHK9_ZIZPA|nr:hypothetical protein GUJ93_ZPchr0008g13723 [Zizania palustris]